VFGEKGEKGGKGKKHHIGSGWKRLTLPLFTKLRRGKRKKDPPQPHTLEEEKE